MLDFEKRGSWGVGVRLEEFDFEAVLISKVPVETWEVFVRDLRTANVIYRCTVEGSRATVIERIDQWVGW